MSKTGDLTVVLLLVLVVAAGTPSSVRAYTGDDFVTALQTKFRTTSNIYLKARSRRITPADQPGASDRVDTATVILAYAYPRQYLQLVAGRGNKRQHIIVKNDSMAIGYPHLDYSRKQTLNEAEARELLMTNVPLAGALLGVSSGQIPGESIAVKSTSDTLHVTIRQFRRDLPFKRVEAEFKRDNLTPVWFLLKGERNFRVDVVNYVEERRFPEWIENALSQLDLGWMEEAPL